MMLRTAATNIRWQAAEAPISLWHATKTFGAGGVRDVTMDVPPGSIMVMVGPSGCGKTTTLQLLTGTYRPDSGRVCVLQEDPSRFRLSTRRQIGYVPQHYALSKTMTIWDTLNFVGSLYGVPQRGRSAHLHEVLRVMDLDTGLDRQVGKLSGGEQRRLTLACALVHCPSIIFADEPTAGIDPVRRHQIWQHFRELRSQGQTLFITTQYIGEIAFCDQVAVMRDGHLLYVETPIGLRRRAFGGDALVMRIDSAQSTQAVQLLMQQPYVRDIRMNRQHQGLLYISVADAGSDLPRLVQLMNQHSVTLHHMEEYKPTFDDVFMLLMEQCGATTKEVRHA